MNYQLEILNQENFLKYQKFTFPRYRGAFSDCTAAEGYSGIGVCNQELPLGLILGKQNPNYPTCMIILSIFVIGEYRRKGIATALFGQFESEVKHKGYQGLELWCIENRESIVYLARILEKSGWMPLKTCDYIYKCRIADFNHPWIEKFQLKQQFSACDLTQLTEAEKAGLRKGCGVWYPEGYGPFAEEERLIPETTLFLKYQGNIIGWCTTFLASSDTIAYRSVFVKKEFQGTGTILPLLGKVTRLHLQKIDRFPYLAFQVALENRVMLKIIKRSMVIELTSVTRNLVSYKLI